MRTIWLTMILVSASCGGKETEGKGSATNDLKPAVRAPTTYVPSPAGSPGAKPSSRAISFRVEEPTGTRDVVVTKAVINIGRVTSAALLMTDDQVSRSHAMIENIVDGVILTDLGSGTRVNGKTISTTALQSGDVIEVGRSKITATFE